MGAISLVFAIFALGCNQTPAHTASAAAPPQRVLRVCSDPNNLPFSNRAQQGFENEIAQLIAKDLHAKVDYFWWAQRRGFVRNTLKSRNCDVILGIPSSMELALVSAPYYRSTYVFVTRADRRLKIESLDDPQLRDLRIGVQIGGDDGEATPPGLALARRGLTKNLRGYSVYGDYSKPHPTSSILDAVSRGDVDVAVVWGPQAGYFARLEPTPLSVAPVSPEIDLPFLPMVYDISFGVRRSNPELKEELERVMTKRRREIDSILAKYGVPRVDLPEVSS